VCCVVLYCIVSYEDGGLNGSDSAVALVPPWLLTHRQVIHITVITAYTKN
jgi:hypothetical protein